MNAKADDIYAEIGRIAVRSTELEAALQAIAGSLIDDYQRYTRIVVTELSFGGLQNLLLSLYRERHGEDADFVRLQEISRRADAAQQKRNLIVHSLWRSAGTPSKVTRVKTTAKQKHGYKTNIENYDLDTFKDIANELHQVRADCLTVLKELITKGKAFDNPVYEHNGS
jgi:hypothetical protein